MEKGRFSNDQVARLLLEVAAVYEIKNESIFKIRAYQNAAASVQHATEEVQSLWEEGRLRELPGVGEALAGHLDELFKKGKSRYFESVKRGLPSGMFEILGVPGIGAKNAFKLSQALRLKEGKALESLKEAGLKGKIEEIEGFGPTSQAQILESLGKTKKSENRMLLPAAQEIADRILKYLRQNPLVLRAEPLGSLRRQVDTIGDIDIAVATQKPQDVVAYFCQYPETAQVSNEGAIKGRIVLKNGRQVDLMTQPPNSFGSLLQHFTGSKNHNIHLRELAKGQGLSLSEKGIKNSKGKIETFKTEEEFYKKLGLDYVAPELREGKGEIVAAQNSAQGKPGGLPRLVEVGDLRGDLQSHTLWSDGRNVLKEMAQAAYERGYEYLGITDHQMSLEKMGKNRILTEIKRRKKEIELINGSYINFRVLNGIELLIKVDDNLAYPSYLLSEFDYVLASIHTGFSLGKISNTERILKAVQNPFVKIIGHPTGRLIGQRPEMEIDWKRVFEACAKYNKVLEIDAMPERLDLPDLLVREALGYGIKFVIDSDAHACQHLDFIRFGVSVARRGWLNKEDVINTLPFAKLKEVLEIK